MRKNAQSVPGWESVQLGEVTNLLKDGTHGTHRDVLDGVPLLSAKDIMDGQIHSDNSPRLISETDYRSIQKSYEIEENDILLTIVGTLGRVAVVPNIVGKRFSVQRSVAIVRASDRIDTRFLAMYFLSPNFQMQLQNRSNASAQAGIYLNELAKIPVPLPPKSQQIQISKTLSSIDEALEASKAVLEQLKTSRQGLIQKSFGDGIRYKFEGYTKDPKVPFSEDWELCKLKALCTRITDGVHQPVLTDSRGTVPFLYVSSIRPGAINWERAGKITQKTYDEISKGRPPSKNVVLYTAVGSYGNAVLLQNDTPVAFQRHIAYVAVDIKKALPLFLEYWLNSSFARDFADRIAVGNAQKTVTLNELSNFPVFLPPMEQQLEIVETLSSLDRRVKAEAERAQQLEVIKQGLMQQLLTGKLRVAVDDG